MVVALTEKWGSENLSSLDKWRDLRDAVPKSDKIKRARHDQLIEDLLMQHAYPRIDVEVSKHLNHLLKSPFVVHPGTGRVCVPLDPKKVDEFDPEKVPDVREVLRELDRVEKEARKKGEGVDSTGPAWDRTALKPYVELFDRHVQGILKETAEIKRGALQSLSFCCESLTLLFVHRTTGTEHGILSLPSYSLTLVLHSRSPPRESITIPKPKLSESPPTSPSSTAPT